MSIREHILGVLFSWRAACIKIGFLNKFFEFDLTNGAFRNFLKFIGCYSSFGKEYQIGISSFGKNYIYMAILWKRKKGFETAKLSLYEL